MDTNQQTLVSKLEKGIASAVKKLGINKENDICRYIPVPTGGYIHHFTMRKMKHEEPAKLLEMIEKHILNVNGMPPKVEPKKRAPRGSKKQGGAVAFSKGHLERMLNMARLVGDKEIVKMLSAQTKDRKSVRRELIQSIKEDRADLDLWNTWVELIAENSTNGFASQAVEQQNLAM